MFRNGDFDPRRRPLPLVFLLRLRITPSPRTALFVAPDKAPEIADKPSVGIKIGRAHV